MPARPRRSTTRALLTGLTSAVVVAALLGAAPSSAAAGAASGAAGDAAGKTPVAGSHDRIQRARAQAVLDEAESLFDGRPTQLAPGRDATIVLRDLAVSRSSLSGAERRQADRILARPTDGNSDPQGDGYQPGTTAKGACNATVCVHWVETSADKVSTTDNNGNGIPDYVDTVGAAVSHVQSTYTGAGYRPAKGDKTLGGNALPDIYLADIGPDGLYGYCTTDQKIPNRGPYDAWAYCVLDNDYALSEFPTNTPLENMEVTAAHEYFHAVQFGYDYLEDSWFMEATATWAEDELYDDVDDNLNYLPGSPLTQPARSLDTFNNGGFQYGTWIFFRYLTELLPDEEGGMPTLVRDMWRKADGASGGPDEYSMQAVATVLKARGTSLAGAFAAFADANRRPATTYSEGSANGYPAAPLGKFVKKSGWYVTQLDHLTSSTASFGPTPGYSQVKVSVDMPPKAAGSAAIATVYYSGGSTPVTTTFPLNRKGNGSKTFPFDPSSVTSVEVTLVNASTRYRCWTQGAFSCQGNPVDDNLAGRIRGVLVQ